MLEQNGSELFHYPPTSEQGQSARRLFSVIFGIMLSWKGLLMVLPELGCPDPPRLARRLKDRNELKVKSIFVGNLDFAVTDSSVRTLFERYGTVDRVNLVTDRDTGRLRGFGFVEMPDASQAEQAIAALNGTNFEGRALNVNEAKPKPNAGPRSSAGGGGGFGRQRREPRW